MGEVTGGDDILEGTEESGSLDGEHHRDQDKGGHGGQDSVKVLGIKVLSDGLSGLVFLERTPRAEEETLESMAEARARKVKESSFMEAMATPPMIGRRVM